LKCPECGYDLKRKNSILIIILSIILLFGAIASFNKPLEISIFYAGDIFAYKKSWWGLKTEVYPIKLINGEWHLKNEHGNWVLVDYSDN